MHPAPHRTWPDDADGDVFRRMEAHAFDFSQEAEIDFNIDFDAWPPSPALLGALDERFSNVTVHVPGPDDDGYVQITLRTLLTYDLVKSMQRSLTDLAAAYGGVCESWGVLQD
jgi:hypothetical protein